MKKVLLLSILLLTIGCSNNTVIPISSSQISTSSIENSSLSETVQEKEVIINIDSKVGNIEDWFTSTEEIGLIIDKENSENVSSQDDVISVGEENKVGTLSFKIDNPINKIEIEIRNEVAEKNVHIGVINQYNVKVLFQMTVSEKKLSYEFEDYLKPTHICFEAKEPTIIEKIRLYYKR